MATDELTSKINMVAAAAAAAAAAGWKLPVALNEACECTLQEAHLETRTTRPGNAHTHKSCTFQSPRFGVSVGTVDHRQRVDSHKACKGPRTTALKQVSEMHLRHVSTKDLK
ncbi:MAG: hypothetical protein GY701_09710 [Sulfitobacter sp.]|nr:hypothetical protein [Sulfitobacter sp.]